MSLLYQLERKVGLEVVEKASKLVLNISERIHNDSITKSDSSPVTIADYASQSYINLKLQKAFPEDRIVGEEDSKSISSVSFQPIRKQILDLVNQALPVEEQIDETKLLASIDLGNYGGGGQGRFWTLDPIDGTKGFLRKEQFAVCLALIVDGEVQVGIIGCPNLTNHQEPSSQKGKLFVAVRGQGAYQRSLDGFDEQPIAMNQVPDLSQAIVCESVESGHSKHEQSFTICQLLNIQKPSLRLDSQAKYGCIASGYADIYLRLPTMKTYQEKIWDHASGCLLVEEAGGLVRDIYGKPLDFSKGRTLKHNQGVVAAPKNIHAQVLKAVQQVLNSETQL